MRTIRRRRHGAGRSRAAPATRCHERTAEIFAAVDWFLAPSRFLLEEFVAYGLPADRLSHGDSGIDTSQLTTVKSTSDVLRFGYVGSLIPS